MQKCRHSVSYITSIALSLAVGYTFGARDAYVLHPRSGGRAPPRILPAGACWGT